MSGNGSRPISDVAAAEEVDRPREVVGQFGNAVRLTCNLVEAGPHVKVTVHDHLIVGVQAERASARCSLSDNVRNESEFP